MSSKKTVTTQKITVGAPSLRTAKFEETHVSNTSTQGTPALRNLDVRNAQSSSSTNFSVSGHTKQIQNINTKLRNVDLRQPESNTYVSRQVETYPKQTVSKTVTVQKSKPGAQANTQSVTRVTKRTETKTTSYGDPTRHQEVYVSNRTENSQDLTPSLREGFQDTETPSLRKAVISNVSKTVNEFTPSLRAGFEDIDIPSLRKETISNLGKDLTPSLRAGFQDIETPSIISNFSKKLNDFTPSLRAADKKAPSVRKEVNDDNRSSKSRDRQLPPSDSIQNKDRYSRPSPKKDLSAHDGRLSPKERFIQAAKAVTPKRSVPKTLPRATAITVEKPDTSRVIETRPEDRIPEDMPEEYRDTVEDSPAV